ncbi:Hypothetical protein mma_2524 [Janthinobacterium sp. Marseille]|nr:hypothetical protein [Janthinobacterium sp. Marseille]ABR91890.1 Hypothetical protein mma_2524 [Janthinobacterium sp. Marseille]
MELHHDIVQYLKSKTKNKLVMTPKQLSEEIPVSVKQQSKLRENKNFPIPHKKVGRNVYYSIFHIADFLMNGEVSSQEEKIEPKPSTRKGKASSSPANLSHLFLLRSFATHIQAEAESLMNLSQGLIRYEQSAGLTNKLVRELKK